MLQLVVLSLWYLFAIFLQYVHIGLLYVDGTVCYTVVSPIRSAHYLPQHLLPCESARDLSTILQGDGADDGEDRGGQYCLKT